MALGIEGSKGVLIKYGAYESGRNIRTTFQELTWRATRGELSFDEFIAEVKRLPPRMSVSAFVNAQCDFGCPHCYLRGRGQFACGLPTEFEIALIANTVGAADFSIVGMEPLETWDRTRQLMQAVRMDRKAMITNARYLTMEVAQWLAEHDVCVDFSIGGSADVYDATLTKIRLLADAGVKATASCMVGSVGVDPMRIIRDISAFGFPIILFPFCSIGERVSESDKRFIQIMELLSKESLSTTIMGKTDFLSLDLLRLAWEGGFGHLDFADLLIDMDEGFLVRRISDKLLFGIYPFPGEFINRIRIDADGALTTCHHMQVPLAERLAVIGDLRYQPHAWLEIPEVYAYHEQYWKSYRSQR